MKKVKPVKQGYKSIPAKKFTPNTKPPKSCK